jgi:hypothetical protein
MRGKPPDPAAKAFENGLSILGKMPLFEGMLRHAHIIRRKDAHYPCARPSLGKEDR